MSLQNIVHGRTRGTRSNDIDPLVSPRRIIQAEPLAQTEEHLTFNQGVLGSSPRRLTNHGTRKATTFMAHILVVDDEPEIRDICAVTLRDAGHHVVLADNGQSA